MISPAISREDCPCSPTKGGARRPIEFLEFGYYEGEGFESDSGVHSGETFNPICAARKVVVDPAFRFSIEEASQADPTASFHPLTSDEYFSKADDTLFDVVFLDGLHTFEQKLCDLMNTLPRVKLSAVIVIDDVLPNGHAATIRDPDVFVNFYNTVPGTDPAWMGDVYRLVYFIAAFMPAWSYATVAENHGQLVLWRQTRPVVSDMLVRDVCDVDFTSVALDKSVFQLKPLREILDEVRGAIGAPVPAPGPAA